jgi:tetratricopeptide (TPR) repeat protein
MWAPAVGLLLFLLQNPDYSAEGLKALAAQRYEDAVRSFTKAVEADPKDYGAQFHLALSYSLLGKDAEAIPRYKTVLELKPGLYEAQLNLGMLLLRQKQAREAAPYLEAAAEKKPKEFRPAFYLAEALLATDEFAKAEQHYKAALELDPKSAAAHLGLARSQARQNRLAEAAPNFRKAAELEAGFKDVLLELGSLYEAAKMPAEAIAVYQQFPDNLGARERLGELLLEAGKLPEAIVHLEFSVEKSPAPANRLALAMAYLRNKETAKALPLLAQAVQSDPANMDLRMAYGRALRDARNFPAAAKEFDQVVKRKPDSREAWNELAAMLILLENYPQALAALDRAAALGPETPAHHYFRAIILDRTKQYQPALANYERFLALCQNLYPDEEFKARQRIRMIKKELSRK